jgi:type I restriction enzyme S subunit
MRNGWVETTLGQYIHINTGKLDVNAASGFGEYPFFTCSRETYRINEAAFKGESVLVAGNGDLNVKYYDGEFNAYQRTYVLNSVDKKILDNRFLFLYMQTYIEYLRSETRGTVIQYLKKGQFTDAKIKLPPLPEQKRIVDLISSVDSYIEALQQQLESAKRSRNAVLHKLLTADGDDWVETPIGDVAQILSGFAFKSELFNKSQGMPLIRIRDLPKRDSTEALYSGSYEDRYVVKKGDFLIGMDGEFHCYEWNGADALLNQRVCRIQDFKLARVIPRYIYFAVNQYLGKIEQDTGYTTVKHISAKQVLGITIPLPPLSEQKRIVELISEMDEFIESVQQNLIEAKNLRSGLLSDLLNGNHEIPTTYDKSMGAA